MNLFITWINIIFSYLVEKNNSFGFGITKKELMEIIINETIPYDNYKQYIFERLHLIFNLSSQESNSEGSKQ